MNSRDQTSPADHPKLTRVGIGNRIALDRFERIDQAEIACGLLRSNGVACELSSMPLHGLVADIVLWVSTPDAEFAWALLADAERQSSNDREVA